jgi:hypothetical protein
VNVEEHRTVPVSVRMYVNICFDGSNTSDDIVL